MTFVLRHRDAGCFYRALLPAKSGLKELVGETGSV